MAPITSTSKFFRSLHDFEFQLPLCTAMPGGTWAHHAREHTVRAPRIGVYAYVRIGVGVGGGGIVGTKPLKQFYSDITRRLAHWKLFSAFLASHCFPLPCPLCIFGTCIKQPTYSGPWYELDTEGFGADTVHIIFLCAYTVPYGLIWNLMDTFPWHSTPVSFRPCEPHRVRVVKIISYHVSDWISSIAKHLPHLVSKHLP